MASEAAVYHAYNHGVPVITPVSLQLQIEENPTTHRPDLSDEKVRRVFIRKVYSLLLVQLAVFFGFLYFCTFHFDTRKFVRSNHTRTSIIFLVAGFLIAVPGLAFHCCECARRMFPLNYILLTLLTGGLTVMLGGLAAIIPPKIIVLAVAATAIICVVITVFAFQTKIDFTMNSGLIASFTTTVVFFGIIPAVTKIDYINLGYSIVSVLLFSWYLIYDTQLIIGGKHKYAFYPEDYVFAAAWIFCDIIGIFAHLAKILSAGEVRRDDE